jgi:hypothetical protein
MFTESRNPALHINGNPVCNGVPGVLVLYILLRPFLTVQQNKNKTILLFCFVYVLSDLSCTSPPVADKNK